jgi:hypothetical protein
MGSQKCRIVGESQPVLIMISPIIFPRTRIDSRELILLDRCSPQTVFTGGDVGHEMYVVLRGEVEITAGKSADRLGFIGQDGFFGEKAVIEAVKGKYGMGACVRTRTVRATTDTDLGMLRAGTYPKALVRRPMHDAHDGCQQLWLNGGAVCLVVA